MIARQPAILTCDDHQRLRALLRTLRDSPAAFSFLQALRGLEQRVAGAVVVPADEIGDDVVTMESVVQVREPGGSAAAALTLVYPGDTDLLGRRVSVLAPLGTALLGSRVGDIVQWETRRSVRYVEIERIAFQPEAATVAGR